MGHFGRLGSVKDLPAEKVLVSMVKESMKLIDEGAVLKQAPPKTSATVECPDYFTKALAKNKKAKAVFDKFPPSHRKEYIMWLTDAKTEATREKRMAQAIEWIAEGKGRNWKYENC